MTALNDGAQILNGALATKRDCRVDFEGGLATSAKSILWPDGFNVAAVNSANYRNPVTTQTVGFANGYATLNNSGITTANTNSAKQTYRTFPLLGSNELRAEIIAFRNNAPQANETLEFGLFNAVLPGGAAPTDGIFFRFAGPVLQGVINFNGAESIVPITAIPAANKVHRWGIVCVEREAEFWIDGVMVARQLINTLANTYAAPFAQTAVPFTTRYYIGAAAPATVTKFMLSGINIDMAATHRESPWADQLAGAGQFLYQGQNGGVMGSTASYANNQATGAGAALSNTAALVSGLGGQAAIQPTLVVGTDGIVYAFQNPGGSVLQTPRLLVITGVRLHSIVTTALTGGAVLLAWTLAFGHNTVSLASAENAATGTKAPRVVPLGFEFFAATATVGAVGTPSGLVVPFRTPIVVNPGEFVALCAKNVGVVTSAGVILNVASFDGYFE